jgi:hypothetical protein
MCSEQIIGGKSEERAGVHSTSDCSKKCTVSIISSQSVTMCNLNSDWTKMIKNKEVSICLKLKYGISQARICTCEEGVH